MSNLGTLHQRWCRYRPDPQPGKRGEEDAAKLSPTRAPTVGEKESIAMYLFTCSKSLVSDDASTLSFASTGIHSPSTFTK
jgi:hypothetical protein